MFNRRNLLFLVFVAIIVFGVIGLVYGLNRGKSSVGEVFSQESVLEEVKKEFECTCGCGLNLEKCETDDPTCPVRPGIVSQAEDLAKEGKTKEEIIDILSGSSSSDLNIRSMIDDDPAIGSEDAPVTIVEFSDYQCPFCATFYLETFSRIKSEYVDTGKVKFVYRDFPLNFHQYAQKSAEASECADEQGKFWEYKDILFKRQAEWSSLGVDKLKDYASELKLDRERFDYCLDNNIMASEVQNDFADGKKYGVSGTPAFFIEGELISGAQPFEVFQQKIDSLLKYGVKEECDPLEGSCQAEL